MVQKEKRGAKHPASLIEFRCSRLTENISRDVLEPAIGISFFAPACFSRGILGGQAFEAGVKGEELSAIVMPYAMPGGILCMIATIVGLIFVVQILVSLTRTPK